MPRVSRIIGDIMLLCNHLAEQILFNPLYDHADELNIMSAYATPNMLSWYLKNIHHRVFEPIKINLIVGMVPFDHLSVSIHEGFKGIVSSDLPAEVSSVKCSYVYDQPAEHGNLYIWSRNDELLSAFTGSANFVQNSFIGSGRREIMKPCAPAEAMDYYNSVISRTVYCNHAEVEEYVIIKSAHPVLDTECNPIGPMDPEKTVELSLITKTGEPGTKSGLNWGQRSGREPNEAYIPLPAPIARSGFFPLEKQHFTALTDDRIRLTLRVEQQGDKAITTPERNSDLGEYFRRRLELANGAYITRADLDRYGRLDVAFTKLDDETFYMDFSPKFPRT